MKHCIIAVTVAVIVVPTAKISGQIRVATGVYRQNFGSLAISGTSNPWADNSTLIGWFAAKTGGDTNITTYRASAGTGTTGALYSYGPEDSAERALGSLATGTVGDIAYAVMFTNDTGQAQTDITISYIGEQWRNSGNSNQHQLYLDYQVTAARPALDAVLAPPWIPFPTLDFLGPTAGTNATALDGNNVTNKQVFTNVVLSGVTLQAGEVLTIRWLDVDDSGSDHGLAIDDVMVVFPHVVPVPEKPLIVAQPQNRTTNAGTSVTFAVTATGTEPFGYQWRRNGTNLSDGGKFVGAHNQTLTIDPVLKADEAGFDVIITNSAGAVTSLVATLTVIDPSINTQPESMSLVPGDFVTLSVSVSGTTPLTYQWRRDSTNLPGADRRTYSISNVTQLAAGGYSVRVSNAVGVVTSATAVVTVLSAPSSRFAHWNFNNTNAPSTTNSPAPSAGVGSAMLLGDLEASFSSGSPTDPGSVSGSTNAGWHTSSYPSQGTSNKTAGVEFRVSTIGYRRILVTWQQRNTSTASRYARFQYTIDGTSFVDHDVFASQEDSVFFQFANDLSAVSGVANNPNFGLRILTEWESTATGSTNNVYRPTTASSYSSAGTIRFDMINVFGDPAQGPPYISRLGLAGGVVTVDFTGDFAQPASAFKLFRSAALGGTFAEAPATITATGEGTFRATVATSGAQQFYRVQQ
jgi:hypothetical protein